MRASVPYTRVLDEHRMPGAKWFEGARLNYAEHAFLHAASDRAAIIARSEARGAFERFDLPDQRLAAVPSHLGEGAQAIALVAERELCSA